MSDDSKIIEQMIKDIAKLAYDSQFDDGYDNLPNNSIERAIWRKTARAVMDYLMIFGEQLGHEVDKKNDSKIILTKEGR